MQQPATKGGIRQLVKALAVDWAPFNIRVNGIGPGYVNTKMTRPLVEHKEFSAWVRKRTPLGRWAMPSDFEGLAVFWHQRLQLLLLVKLFM